MHMYQKPALTTFQGWDVMFAAGETEQYPDPGDCVNPGIEDDF